MEPPFFFFTSNLAGSNPLSGRTHSRVCSLAKSRFESAQFDLPDAIRLPASTVWYSTPRKIPYLE